jgi:Ca-activated chloride channel homolog
MRILDPRYFWLLLVLVPLWLFSILSHYRSQVFLSRLGYGKDSSINRKYLVRNFFRFIILNCILIFSVLALADFQWGARPESNDRKNLDIALVVDVSNSMLAQDADGSRLDRCRDAIFLLLENISQTRYSFTLFKGEPVLFIPLTEDLITLENFLHRIGPDYISSSGSDLEKALRKGASTLPDDQERNRAVLLFTDGEGLEGNVLQAARELYSMNIQLFTFGVGTEEGDFIRLSDGDLLNDREGQVVVTKQNKRVLEEMAELTGGTYLDLTEIHNLSEIEQILSDTYGNLEARGVGFTSIHRYRLFCNLALFFMIIYLILGKMRWY